MQVWQKGGSGDVLTGILTALVGQYHDAIKSAILGVYLHGLAGDIAAEKYSKEAMIAGDIIENLGEAFMSIPVRDNEGRSIELLELNGALCFADRVC